MEIEEMFFVPEGINGDVFDEDVVDVWVDFLAEKEKRKRHWMKEAVVL